MGRVIVTAAIAALAVVAVGVGLAVRVGRAHRQERHEVENMFSSEADDRVWWDDRR
jgi:hypothetical protein